MLHGAEETYFDTVYCNDADDFKILVLLARATSERALRKVLRTMNWKHNHVLVKYVLEHCGKWLLRQPLFDDSMITPSLLGAYTAATYPDQVPRFNGVLKKHFNCIISQLSDPTVVRACLAMCDVPGSRSASPDSVKLSSSNILTCLKYHRTILLERMPVALITPSMAVYAPFEIVRQYAHHTTKRNEELFQLVASHVDFRLYRLAKMAVEIPIDRNVDRLVGLLDYYDSRVAFAVVLAAHHILPKWASKFSSRGDFFTLQVLEFLTTPLKGDVVTGETTPALREYLYNTYKRYVSYVQVLRPRFAIAFDAERPYNYIPISQRVRDLFRAPRSSRKRKA